MEKTNAAFIEYLYQQVGQPYIWGGQHTKLTPQSYVALINKKEGKKGGYKDETYAEAVIRFCKEKFAAGATALYAYDCSGLGVYFLHNLTGLYKTDASANTMMSRCTLSKKTPQKGWWVFRLSGKKAVHIGYMVSDTQVIQAQGRRYGVTLGDFVAKEWDCWGIPKIFAGEIGEASSVCAKAVKVLGNTINVRDSDSTAGKVLFIAKKGQTFPYVETAKSGWYKILAEGKECYITNLPKYTMMEEDCS